MHRILAACALGTLMVLGLSACGGDAPASKPDAGRNTSTGHGAAAPDLDRPVGAPLYAHAQPVPGVPEPLPAPGGKADPIVIHDARFAVIDRQDVPSQRDGVIWVIGTEVGDDEEVPADRLVTIRMGKDTRRYRRLKEGDRVKAGQMLAQMDNRLAAAEAEAKAAKIIASKADLEATIKTRDEANERYLSRTRSRDAPEEVRGAWLTWQRYISEVTSKEKGVELAKLEKQQADVVLAMHRIDAAIDGEVRTIYKKPGEAVKALETVFQIQNSARLRVEGLIDVQYLPRVRPGMKVTIEPTLPTSHVVEFKGHLQEITGVAVGNDPKNPLIVSASEDGTVRVWEGRQRREKAVFWHPAAVRAVACSPAGSADHLCLSGAADGKGRLWDLSADCDQPLRVLAGSHRGAITCVAFSPDGQSCATGGEDREIYLWDTATGQLRYRLPAGHKGAVTSLQFTPLAQLVSAGRDNTLILWQLGEQAGKLVRVSDRRSGEVTTLGASPDGKLVLFDQGKMLRVLTLPGGLTEAVLQNASGATTFATLALWSPDGRQILTGSASDGRLQLWRAPGAGRRVCEIRQLVHADRTPFTCAAFSPDGRFIVTGNRDRQVMVWPMPPADQLDQEITGEVTLLERDVQAAARQVRIWAEVANPEGILLPGGTAKIVIYPE